MEKINPNPVGRPSDYTQEKADLICSLIAEGRSLSSVCREEGMPGSSSVFRWLRENQEFRKNYDTSMRERTLAHGEQLIDISDDGTNDWMEDQYMKGKSPGWKVNGEAVQRSKLRVDTRKWLMSKMEPKKYGDKMDVTSGGEPISVTMVNYKKDGDTTAV